MTEENPAALDTSEESTIVPPLPGELTSGELAHYHVEGRARPSSRESPAAAGWKCDSATARWRERWRAALKADENKTPEQARMSWKSLRTLWSAKSEKLARPPRGLRSVAKALGFRDHTHAQRAAWVAEYREKRYIDRNASSSNPARTVFMVLGDTGEGDASQYAVIEPLVAEAEEAEFTVIASDVIYPAGAANAYNLRFYDAYQDLPGPIFAVPGNHDWDDGYLAGFMYHICGMDEPPDGVTSVGNRLQRRVAGKLPPHSERSVMRRRHWRNDNSRDSQQKTPYFALDTGPLRILAIDTGYGGPIDREQGEWLLEMSQGDRPKILVTGRPLYVDGKHHPGAIDKMAMTIDEIVRQPANNYIAAIGGDIHNYQRYPVVVEGTSGEGRTRLIQYLVSGGGGAFTTGTHTLDKIQIGNRAGLPSVVEDDVRLYPLRGDSLSFYSFVYADTIERMSKSERWYAKAGGIALGWIADRIAEEGAAFVLHHALATRVMNDHTGAATPRDLRHFSKEQLEQGERVRKVVSKLPNGFVGDVYYPFWDRDEPPFFKSFLRVEADEQGVRIRCFAATGCPDYDQAPPVEDTIRWDPDRGWAARYAGLGAEDESVRGRAEVYRRSGTDSELVITFREEPIPAGARVRLSRTKYLDENPVEVALASNDGGTSASVIVPGNHRFGSIELVGPDKRRIASGRFW